MKNRFTSMTTTMGTVAAALLLSACMLSELDKDDNDIDNGESGSEKFSMQQDMVLLAHTPPQNGQPGVLVLREIDTWCEDGVPTADTLADTSLYVIQGGELFVWGAGDCTVGERLSGSSATIFGTWTSTYIEGTGGPVPEPHRASDCDDPSDGEYEDDYMKLNLFDDQETKIVVSSDKISMKMTGTLCYARAMAAMYASSSPGIDTVSVGCTEVVLRNAANQTAKFTSAYSNGKATLTFVHGDSTCVLGDSFDLFTEDDAAVCSDDDEGGDEGFACMFGSGFFGEMNTQDTTSVNLGKKGGLRSIVPMQL